MRNFVVTMMMVCALAACKKDKPKEVVLTAVPTAPTQVNGMPALTITKKDGSTLSMKQLTGKILLVCYNPDCDHCQREATRISENKDMIKDYQVYFMTTGLQDPANTFDKDYHLVEPNIHFVTADVSAIVQALGQITTVPTLFVYKNQSMIKRMEGEVSIQELRNVLN